MRDLRLPLFLTLLTYAGGALAEPVTAFMAAYPVLGSVLGGVASGVTGSLLSADKPQAAAAPAAPAVEKPTPMPTVDDAAMQAAKKRSIVAQMQRQGRASTILTADAGDKMGG